MLTTLWNAGGQNWRPTKSLLLASSLKSTGKAAWQDNDISGWGKTMISKRFHVFKIHVVGHGNEECAFSEVTRKKAAVLFRSWLKTEPHVSKGWK